MTKASCGCFIELVLIKRWHIDRVDTENYSMIIRSSQKDGRSYHGGRMKKKDHLKEQIVEPHSLKISENELPLYEMNPTIVIANTYNF
jgi:hypothetical protein